MRTAVILGVLAACSHHTASPPAVGDAPTTPDTGPPTYARCGDGLTADCQPALFTGVFVPGVASDPQLAQIEAALGRPLSVIQTYRATSATDVAYIESDLAAIFARGQVAHLNIEPAGYSATQYAAPDQDPLATDLAAVGGAIAHALASAPAGRVIVTFGAEMNGNWTDWGCLSAAAYIALYRAAHDAAAHALTAAGIDARRARWAYGPNSTSSANCGSAAGYYPGHAYVDLLGMSAYRTGTESVDAAVLTPMTDLFDALALPAAWRRARFVALQTGSRAIAGDDRDAWIAQLVDLGTADTRVAGAIYFDADDGPSGWSLAPADLGAQLARAPAASAQLDGVFLPHFWDVPFDHAAFPEIQALADARATSGCATDPPQFCPDDAITAADAMALCARAGLAVTLADPVTEADLAAALGMPAAPATPATRARAAQLIAPAARLVPQPL